MGLRKFTLVTHVVRKGDGQGRVNLEVVKEALRQGVGVKIVASEIADELRSHPLVEWIPINVRGVPSHLLKELVFASRSSRAIREHGIGPLASNGCITRVPAQVNACHFVHSSWLKSPVHSSRIIGGARGRYQWLYSWWNARLEKQAYLASEFVVAVSEQVRQELSEAGIPLSSIVTVPNGVDSVEFAPGSNERRAYGLPESTPLALFAGDIRSPRKNLDTVLKAIKLVPEVQLAVAGGLDGSPYPSMAIEMGIGERVHFLGNVKTMPALMRSCDAFAFPSRYEACSLVMLEAMASGLPVITSRTTGGAELVPEDGGFLLNLPDDIEGMANALRSISSDPTGLRIRSTKVRSRAIELGWDTMGKRYLELLSQSLTGRSK